MLGRLCRIAVLPQNSNKAAITALQSRWFSTGNEDESKKTTPVKDAVDKKVVKAVNEVASSLHKDEDSRKKVHSTLLQRLTKMEAESFKAATESSKDAMQSDKSVVDLINQVATDTKQERRLPNRFAAQRHANRGLVLLRREMFYQAKQEGYSAAEAQKIAEKAVNDAEAKIAAKRDKLYADNKASKVAEAETTQVQDEKERKLFNYAYQMAEKILHRDEETVTGTQKIEPNPELFQLLSGKEKLGIFSPSAQLRDLPLAFWRASDERAAKIVNSPMGPGNALEEQIEWTRQGKQWPYPINNEYLLGEEENVSFIEHIFLDRHLAKLGLPRDGPIGHFMELVCVGLSKNPYMTARKKQEHLQWFASYFNAEKTKLIEKLHKQELEAAAN
ncbi:unnamed protein product, partial [Mesorhabditis spiculigera]